VVALLAACGTDGTDMPTTPELAKTNVAAKHVLPSATNPNGKPLVLCDPWSTAGRCKGTVTYVWDGAEVIYWNATTQESTVPEDATHVVYATSYYLEGAGQEPGLYYQPRGYRILDGTPLPELHTINPVIVGQGVHRVFTSAFTAAGLPALMRGVEPQESYAYLEIRLDANPDDVETRFHNTVGLFPPKH
jgi:hypothetical protein